jgi:transcriptional antiterminator RfaH
MGSQSDFQPLGKGECWYVVHTLPFCETRAQAQIENQGFRTFLPKRLKTVRHARKLSTVTAVFFPRYFFVVLDLARDQWRSVNGTFGVASMVMQGDQPHPVPRGVVETLIAATDLHGNLQLGEHLKVGGSIRVAVGPFADQLAILDRIDESGRIRVLLGMLGRKVSVLMDLNNVLPAAQ